MNKSELAYNIRVKTEEFYKGEFIRNPKLRNAANRIIGNVEKIQVVLENMAFYFEQDNLSEIHFDELYTICIEMITQAQNLRKEAVE